MHDAIDIALGLVVGACGWLIQRLVGRVDSAEEAAHKHGEEIRDTRSAIARLEGHLGLPPFPYSRSGD